MRPTIISISKTYGLREGKGLFITGDFVKVFDCEEKYGVPVDLFFSPGLEIFLKKYFKKRWGIDFKLRGYNWQRGEVIEPMRDFVPPNSPKFEKNRRDVIKKIIQCQD